MKEINFDAADSDVFVAAERIAFDEFFNLVDMDNPIFFYGKVINDDPFNESDIDERKDVLSVSSLRQAFQAQRKARKRQENQMPEMRTGRNSCRFQG